MATTALRLSKLEATAMSGAERFAWTTVGYNVLVIVWGALVRATGSGAGCGNHWPLCNGQVIPLSPTVHTAIEFTHRCMTGGSLFVVLGLLVWTYRATEKGFAARVFATISMGLLLNEALLGALLVKLGYVTGNQSVGRMAMLSIHLSNTLLLLGALTLTAWSLRMRQEWVSPLKLKEPLGVAVGLAATLFIGVSGSLAALGDTLFPSTTLRGALAKDVAASSHWLVRFRWVHPVSAVVAAAFVLWLMARAPAARAVRLMRIVIYLVVAQFVLGIADVLLLAPPWMQMVHLFGADLYWVALVALTAKVSWPTDAALRASVSVRP